MLSVAILSVLGLVAAKLVSDILAADRAEYQAEQELIAVLDRIDREHEVELVDGGTFKD